MTEPGADLEVLQVSWQLEEWFGGSPFSACVTQHQSAAAQMEANGPESGRVFSWGLMFYKGLAGPHRTSAESEVVPLFVGEETTRTDRLRGRQM